MIKFMTDGVLLKEVEKASIKMSMCLHVSVMVMSAMHDITHVHVHVLPSACRPHQEVNISYVWFAS